MSWSAHFRIVSLVVLPVSVMIMASGFLANANCTVLCHLCGVDMLPLAFMVVMQKELSLYCRSWRYWLMLAVWCGRVSFIMGDDCAGSVCVTAE